MKTLWALLASLLAQTCAPLTMDEVHATIEKRLAAHPCIGEAGRWRREYFFRKHDDIPGDSDEVDILYRQPTALLPAGRASPLAYGEWPMEAGTRIAWGRYLIEEDELTLHYCGFVGDEGMQSKRTL